MLAGHVSDWYGRRAVMLPTLAIAVATAVVFLAWRSLAGLLVAGVLTGLALGAAVATATGFIMHFARRSRRCRYRRRAGSWPRRRTLAAWPAVR